ncbi:MAG: hypothetical protein ACK5RX_01075 [bacterium]
MVIQLLAILLMLAIAYVWSARGFLSSLLNMAVVLTSGAIAFGSYEFMTAALLGASEGRLLTDIAPGLGLLLPFTLSLIILSVLVNVFVRANVRVTPMVDWIGGAACGVVAGMVVSGIFMIGSQMIRMSPDALEYQGAKAVNNGSVVRSGGLWLPVDRWVAGLYGYLSINSLETGRPLSVWRPHMAYEGAMNRIGPAEILMRNSLREKDVKFLGRYTVGMGSNIPLPRLVGDGKDVQMVTGETITAPAYTQGFVVQFEASSREKTGQTIISPGQVTLVAMRPDGVSSAALSPVAVVSQAKGDQKNLGRWRFDSRDVYIGTPGAETRPMFFFEFVIPETYRPLALYVRGVRFDLTTDDRYTPIKSNVDFKTPEERDRLITRNRFESTILGEKANANALVNNPKGVTGVPAGSPNSILRVANNLPFGVFLDASFMSGLDKTEKGMAITGGKLRLPRKDLSPAGTEMNLRVDAFDPGNGTAIVQLDISRNSPLSPVQPNNSEFVKAPALIGIDGQRFEAIGYVYRTSSDFTVSFDPAKPIRNFDDLPSVSRSIEGQDLILIFRVSVGVRIEKYAVGNTVLGEFVPPQAATQQRVRDK